jgi:peptidoglycan/LPS O-acetylase OafA/YrhL
VGKSAIYILIAAAFLVAAGIVNMARNYRRTENRAIVAEIVRDRRAMVIGGGVVLAIVVTATVDGGVTGFGDSLVPSLLIGGLVATLAHRARRST